jgi:membrane fusion protein, multidrug efflux system
MNLFKLYWLRTIFQNMAVYGALTTFIIGCASKAEVIETPSETPVASPAIPVDGLVIRPATLSEKLEVTGTLVANQQVDIVSELTRKIVRVNVKEGSKVQKGTLLFQLDDADLQAQLQRLHQQEKLAKLNEARLKDLIEKEAIAQQDYDEAITNLKVLQAQILELEVMISKTKIVAPFNGQIGIINYHPGAIVSVNTILTKIEDYSVVKVEFSIPEKYSNIIDLGSEQEFTITSDQQIHKTTVVAKESSVNQETRTLLIRGATPNPKGKLLPGQSARISLALHSSENALSVVSQSVIPSPNGYSVYVSRNNTVELQPVEIGQRSAGAVEITQGLAAGDTVITSNLLRLVPGAPVAFVTVN